MKGLSPLYFYHRWARFFWPCNIIACREYAAIRSLALKLPPATGIGLDIGCGVGHSLHLNTAVTLVGVEKNHRMARLAKKSHGIPVVIADAVFLPFKKKSLSAVTAVGLTEYIADMARFFSEIERIGSDDIAVILTSSPPTLFTRLRRIISPGIHMRTAEELCRFAGRDFPTLVEIRRSFTQHALMWRRRETSQKDRSA
jgi:SAM-dependent methyltransferase